MSYTQSLNSMFGGGIGAITTTHIGELHIGSNVKSIPEMAFKYIALDQEELVLDMEKISNEAFRGNDIHIGRLVIGEHVTKMGYGMTESATIGTLDYNAASAAGSSAYGVFGPTYSGRRHTVAGTVNIGEGVKSIPRSCFENMSIGTVNYNAVSSTYKGSESFSMFQNSPSEKEVFGEITNATRAWWNTYYVQYPIFALTGRTRVKMEEEGGTRADWWLLNVNSGDAEQAVIADGYGYDYHSFATRPFSVPICFRIAAKAK